MPVPALLPVPPAPTVAARTAPPGSQTVAEKFAAAPPIESCALPPPPPTSVAVTKQPPGGAVKLTPVDGAITLRPVPEGSIWLAGADVLEADGVGMALGVSVGDGIGESVALIVMRMHADEPAADV